MKQLFTRLKNYLSKPLPFIALLAVIATWLRSIFMAKADIWHDEGYSTAIINYPLGEIITRTMNDVHPPFYYLILSIWQGIFGSSVVSLRGFSVFCGVLTVILLYMLMRRLFPEKVAKLTAIFAAFGPFLIRYSDEVRMYSLAALLAVLSTYLLVVALSKTDKKRYIWWIGYALTIAAGIYTQYFFIFLVFAHIIYALSVHGWRIKKLLTDKGWWLGNGLGALLFLPWLPTMLAQTSRVQEGFWIPPLNLGSISGTISNFVAYSGDVATIFGYSLLGLVIALPIYRTRKNKKALGATLLLVGWLAIPFILVALLSISRPVYIDRYFTYSAPAFYALLAITITSISVKRHKWVQPALAALCIGVFTIGIFNVANVATHRMGQAVSMINADYQPGDRIVSAELYTYFDLSYYNQTGAEVQLLRKDPFGKYGELSLLHDKPELRVAKLDDIDPGRVWLVGKVGEKDYFNELVPDSWSLELVYQAGDSAVRLYNIAK